MNLIDKLYENLTYKNYNFQDGDLVKIKSWEEMCKEFDKPLSVNTINIPSTGCYFSSPMKVFCGKVYTVLRDNEDRGELIKIKYDGGTYIITKEMVRLYKRSGTY